MTTGWVIFTVALVVIIAVLQWYSLQLRRDARRKAATGLDTVLTTSQRRTRLALRILGWVLLGIVGLIVLGFIAINLLDAIFPNGFRIG